MSSQASSAGHGEKEVRRKLVQTGDVDVMVAIRANFFYTRTVPCELWHFDRAKPQARKDQMLMLDARQVYRKVTRKIYDFSPEQQANLAAIVWLYRGEQGRYLGLVRGYAERLADEAGAIGPALGAFEDAMTAARVPLAALHDVASTQALVAPERQQPLVDALAEWQAAAAAYAVDRAAEVKGLNAFAARVAEAPPQTNAEQLQTRQDFDPMAEGARGLVKQVDLLYKLATRTAQVAQELAADEAMAAHFDRRGANRLMKLMEEARKAAVEQLKAAGYMHRQIAWLQERFPDAQMCAVPGLCKVVSRAEIEAADWSLTPGRFVGVAPAEVDEDFDFEQALRDIHMELGDLNREARELAQKIQQGFEELGV